MRVSFENGFAFEIIGEGSYSMLNKLVSTSFSKVFLRRNPPEIINTYP